MPRKYQTSPPARGREPDSSGIKGMETTTVSHRWPGPPLALQIMGLLLGGLVVAQLATLALTLLLPPEPQPQYNLNDIARALSGAVIESRGARPLQRVIQTEPPELTGPGWLTSERSRRDLAGLLGRGEPDVQLYFFTPLPFAGTARPALQVEAEPEPAVPRWRSAERSNGDTAAPRFMRVDYQVAQAAPQPQPQPHPTAPPGTPGTPGVRPGFSAPLLPPPSFPLPSFPRPTIPAPSLPARPAGPGGDAKPEATAPAAAPPDAAAPTMAPEAAGAAAPAPAPAPVPSTQQPTAPAAAAPPTTKESSTQDRPAPDATAVRPTDGTSPTQASPSPTGPTAAAAVKPAPTARTTAAPSTQPPISQTGAAVPRRTETARETVQAPASSTAQTQPTAAADAAAPAATTAAAASPPEQSAQTGPATSTLPAIDRGLTSPRPIAVSSPMRTLFGLGPAPFIEGDFVATMRIANVGWAIVQPIPEPFPNAWQRRVLLWFAIAAAVVVPVGWLFSRRLVRPIAGFAAAAEQLGRDPTAPILALEGPAEIGRAAQAFNRMQSRLRSFVDDRTAMIGAISHDLRTPLTRMRFRIEDIPDDLQENMLNEVEEMEQMISSVLAFSRDASEPGSREVLDLSTIVEDVVENAVFVGKDVTLEGSEKASVEVDAIGMRRVLGNLVENAVKYGGQARVRLFTDRQDAVAEISDNGPGLPDEEMERVFQPFYRAPDARASDKQGTGLGLAVCRSIARAHGGDVQLRRGTAGLIAQVRLPLAFGVASA